MPYPIWVGDKLLIEFPHQYTINDHRMQEEGTRHEFFEKFKDEFDYRYKIGGDNPTMMNVITHAYLSSRIPLIDTFEQIIAYATSHKDVWLARRGDVRRGRGSRSWPGKPNISFQCSNVPIAPVGIAEPRRADPLLDPEIVEIADIGQQAEAIFRTAKFYSATEKSSRPICRRNWPYSL